MANQASMIKYARQWLPTLLAATLLLSGCEKQSDPQTSSTPESAQSIAIADTQALTQVTAQAWQQGHELAKAVEPSLLALQQAAKTLTKDPSELNLAKTREQWHLAHQQLLQLQPFFTLGHINPGLFKQLENAQWQLDAWPIEPGYLDYFDVYKHSGIVNDIALPITAEAIRQQHGFSSDNDVAIGMHSIAYLLWGEQQQRPASDFAAQAPSADELRNGMNGADIPTRRRGALLNLLLTLMLDDLRALDYKLDQSASGLNISYAKLPAQSQLQLWQQSIDTLLRQQLIGEQISPLKNATVDSEFYQHQQFAGQQARSIVAILTSVESLLTKEDADGQTLAQAMNPALEISLLRQTFIDTRQLLLDAEPKWNSLTTEEIDNILQQIEFLAGQLNPQPQLPSNPQGTH